METKATNEATKTVIFPQRVWETLEAKQQMIVIQTIVNLCLQMIEVRNQEEKND
ncbi:MAG: hypothetical protein K8R77_14500 [Anaerolineaceae bacterium]|nr:hypothetical protein [Anaerolineaceae bacterium]